ncbi:MAG TPA: ABC transporter ATP-binding protein [Terrimesophilobacter sp.]|uniref:ABC transporter ATP-binding protein n=1 Tax=Terrimesophilobacter sp. TaxID=2906435 RepID=UPI002F956562
MYSTARRAFGFLDRGERTKFILLVVARALSGLLDVFGIVLIGVIASIAAAQLSSAGDEPTTILGFEIPHLKTVDLFWLVVVVLLVFTVKAAIAIALTRALAFFVASVESRNAERLSAYLLNGRLDDVKKFSKADLQFAITGSMTYAFTGILNNIATLASEGFLLLVITATFFIVDPIAAVFTLAYFGVIVVIIQVFIGHSLKRAGQEAVAGTVDTMNALSDTLDTFREISVLHKQDHFIGRIAESRRRISTSDATMTFLAGMPRYVVETALILGVVLLVGQQFLSGQLAAGMATVGVFLTGGVRMMASLLPLQSAVANIKQNVEKSRSALGLLVQQRDAERAVEAAAVTQPDDPVGADRALRVLITDAGYRYPDAEQDTLHEVSLDISAGSYVAIIGPSGAGKTTLVDLILGLIAPDTGSVAIGGVEPSRLRSQAPGLISYVPQKPGLMSGTIAENIALGVPAEEIDQVRLTDAIESAFLSEFIATLPDGVNTSVGKQVDSLSGGQIQRIGVARALYSQPRLLILDEATSGLDAASEAFISASLRTLHGKVTVIVIAHRLSTVQHADVVHLLENGRVKASGDFKTVKATVPMVAEYVKLMSFEDD